MQTRARAKAQTVPSSGNPVTPPLEGSGSRPPSMASEDEGDLGLVSLLGEGAVSDVGGKCTSESATSGLGDTTVVAAQAPIPEVEVIASDGQIVLLLLRSQYERRYTKAATLSDRVRQFSAAPQFAQLLVGMVITTCERRNIHCHHTVLFVLHSRHLV